MQLKVSPQVLLIDCQADLSDIYGSTFPKLEFSYVDLLKVAGVQEEVTKY